MHLLVERCTRYSMRNQETHSLGLARVNLSAPFTRVAGYVEAERVAKQGKLGIWRPEAVEP